ncbi:MAG: hypothetical protein NTU57_00125 [Candidatus Aenigmarchaeota archaeon]|nr:hypothetical protein [Candidatus Aenigmarchaeota archaeon]
MEGCYGTANNCAACYDWGEYRCDTSYCGATCDVVSGCPDTCVSSTLYTGRTCNTACSSCSCTTGSATDCLTQCGGPCTARTGCTSGACSGLSDCGDNTCADGIGCTSTCSHACGAECDVDGECTTDYCAGTCGTGADSCAWRDYYCTSGCACTYDAYDADTTSGRCTGCSQNWNTGGSGDCTGESGCTTACCGDDSGENYRTFVEYAGNAHGVMDWGASQKTCCDAADQINYNSQCVTSGSGGNAVDTGYTGHDKYGYPYTTGWLDLDGHSTWPAVYGANVCGGGWIYMLYGDSTGERCGTAGGDACDEDENYGCCGDDAGEYYLYRQNYNYPGGDQVGGITATATGDYACCDTSTDCVYNNVCYALSSDFTTTAYDLDGNGVKDSYCYNNGGTGQWLNVDRHQSYCDASPLGSGHWNIGGDADAETSYYQAGGGGVYCDIGLAGYPSRQCCCGDDAGEYYNTCTDSSANGDCGADTTACCSANTKCIDHTGACQSTDSCYTFGSGGLMSWCNSGTWEDPDEASGYCTATGCAYSWMSNVPTSGTRCCGDDTGSDNSYYYSANPTTATSLSCERCNAGTYASANTYYGNGYMPGSSTTRTCYYGDITCSAASGANGTSISVYGWGWYNSSLTTTPAVICLSGAATCSDGSAANDSASTLYGNGRWSGTDKTTDTSGTCYYGDITCSDGSEGNGASASLIGNGNSNGCSLTTATGCTCYYGDLTCADNSAANGTSTGIIGNGNLQGSGTSRTCYYGDMGCSDNSATNGTTQTVFGWGWYNASLTTTPAVLCMSDAATCTNGNAANDTISILFGNGYLYGSGTSRVCFYNDITCASGSENNGTSATVYGWGWYNSSLTTTPAVICRSNAGSCSDGSYANDSATTLCGNGYFSSSAASCSSADATSATSGYCYYGDITCSSGSEANGAVSSLLLGNGYTTDTPASDASGTCFYDDITCANGNSANGTQATVYGNGYDFGATCYHGDWSCGDGTYANGSSCTMACSGASECCTSQNIYTDAVGCSDTGCAQTNHERDSGSSYCTATASGCTAYDWNIGGEINASVCCGDDAGENILVRFCGSWCTSNSSDDACCDAGSKCVYENSCYDSASCYSNDAYCDAGTWRDSDGGQTYCEACAGAGRWNAGGEISPTTCCSDDTGENYAYRLADGGMDNSWATNSSDNACCNAADKCVAESVCYASGSRNDTDSDGDDDYCNAGTWYDCNTQSDCPAGYDCYGGDCVDVIDLSYVLPTPSHDSVNTDNSVTINVTANDTQGNGIDTCTLEWNGVNETMTKHGSGTYVTCHSDKATMAGQSYTFRVYANDSAGVIELENERTFAENTVPSMMSVYMNVSYAKNGDTVIIASSGASDGDGDTYCMRCGNTSGDENVCNSTLGSGEMNCTFASAWSGNSQHPVYCRLYDGYEYSSESNASLTADNTPPTPEPAQVSSLALGSTTASVTSVVASDSGSGLHATAYRFYDAGVWSDWQASNVYVNSSLAPNTQYCFRAQCRDNVSNVGTQSNETCNYTLADQPSITRVACYYGGTHICVVNFSMALNPTGVDYYIEETSGNAGGSDENWTTWSGEPSYSDVVSMPHTQYCYRIKARNQNDEETSYSSAVCNTTYNNLPSASNVKTYDSTMTQKSLLRAGRMIYIRADATDGDGAGDIESVKIRIRNNNSDIMVNNADMTAIASITDGYTYQYQYTIPSNADGVWQIEITATDLGAAENVTYASFTVVSLKLNIKLVLNETQASTYVPGAGEKSFADLAYAYYAIPQNYYITSYYAGALYGLVFQNQQPLGVLVDKGVDSVTLGLDLKYPNSIAFVVSSKGDWKNMQNRIGLINSGSFLQFSEPTFSFGLGDKYPMAIVLNYDNMDILGRRMDVGKGSNNIAIRHEGLFDEDIGLNISRK